MAMKRHCTYIIYNADNDVAIRSYFKESEMMAAYIQMLKEGRRVYFQACYS